MTDPTEQKRPSRLRRLARVALIVLIATGVLATVAALAWRTGRPQRWLVVTGLERVFGARTEATGVVMGRTATIDTLALYDTPSQPDDPALVRFQGVELEYAPWPTDSRYLTRLAIQHAAIDVRGTNPADPNYDFLLRFLRLPSSGKDPTPFIPRAISIDSLAAAAELPAWSIQLDGVHAQGAIDTLDALTFRLHGEPLRARWSVAGIDTALNALEGNVDLNLTRRGDLVNVDGLADVPGLALLDLTSQVTLHPLQPRLNATVREATFQGALWGAVAEDLLPVPVRFDLLRITDSRLDASLPYGAFVVNDTRLSAEAQGVVIGPADAPYFSGGLQLAAEGNLNPDSQVDATLVFDRGQTLQAVIRRPSEGPVAEIVFKNWTRDQLADLVPVAHRNLLDSIPNLASLSFSGDALWASPDYEIAGRLTPVLEGHGPVDLDVTARSASDQSRLTEGSVTTSWREGTASVQWFVDSPSSYQLWIDTADLAPREWVDAWAGPDVLAGLGGKVTGSARLLALPDAPSRVTANLRVDGLTYGPVNLPPDMTVECNAKALWDGRALRSDGEPLRLNAGGAARVALGQWHASLDPLEAACAVECEADLGVLAAWSGLPDLHGEGILTAHLVLGATALDLASLSLKAETIGYGDWTTPYRMPVTAKANARLAFDGGTLASDSLVIALGDDTTLTAEKASVNPSGQADSSIFAMENVTLETAFAPFVSKGYLEEATGTATVKAPDIRYGEQGFTGAFNFDLAADTLVLPDTVAALYTAKAAGNLQLAAEVQADGPLTAHGVLTAAKAIAGGAALHNVRGEIRGHGETLRFANIRGTLFDGAVEAEVAVDLFEPGFPLRVSVSLEEADLAAFTQEYQLTSIRLTGNVRGTASIAFGPDGLEDLHVELESSNGLTLNRDAVAQLLLSQYVGEVTAGKTLSKAVQRTIGDEPDRPFDSGRLNLGYKNGEIVGTAKLESPLLNMTVDIKADPETLNDAIMLRQAERVQFETVENQPEEAVQ